MDDTLPDILCKRCKAKIPTLNALRKWCVNCRKELTNERARLHNKQRRAAGNVRAGSRTIDARVG